MGLAIKGGTASEAGAQGNCFNKKLLQKYFFLYYYVIWVEKSCEKICRSIEYQNFLSKNVGLTYKWLFDTHGFSYKKDFSYIADFGVFFLDN